MIWPNQIAAFRNEHLLSNAHKAIMRIAEIEAFILEQYGIEPNANHVPAEIKAFAFLAFVKIDATPEQIVKLDAEIERQLAALRKGAH
jgi:hypothetical protein